jgi:hypothetical protein
VFVVHEHPDEGEPWICQTITGSDGTVSIPIMGWGSIEQLTRVEVDVYGPVTRTETQGDCVLSFGPTGQAAFDHYPGQPTGLLVVDTVSTELDAVCSTTGEPPSTGGGVGGGAGPTLPPTDSAIIGESRQTTPALALTLVLLAAVALGALEAVRSRSGGRGR